jgi:hypothetical protein
MASSKNQELTIFTALNPGFFKKTFIFSGGCLHFLRKYAMIPLPSKKEYTYGHSRIRRNVSGDHPCIAEKEQRCPVH